MKNIFHFTDACRRDPDVEAWLSGQDGQLGVLARHWFEVLRGCGDDVRECLHDGHPTACVTDAAFAYVDAFTAHVNVGFYQGAGLPDPAEQLEGKGELMRHVKLRPGEELDSDAVISLVQTAYTDMKRRIAAS